jgi:putative ABC transport system permease protein
MIGGAMGLFLVFALATGANAWLHHIQSSFVFHVTLKNVLIGVSLAVAIGVLAGFIPAWQASRMRPVDAIRST